MTIETAASLGAQLPMLVRGFYYEGWKPSAVPLKMNKDEFIGEIERNLLPIPEEDTEKIVKDIFYILESFIDPAEIEKIKKTLPKEILKILK